MHDRRGITLSLRHLLLLLTAIGFLPLALLGSWGLMTAAGVQQREQDRSMLELARALSSAVDAEHDGAAAALAGIANSPLARSGDMRTFHDVATQQARAQAQWLGVILSDAAGRSVFRTMAPFGAPPAPVADPSSLARAVAGRAPVAGGVVRGAGGRAAFPVRVPVDLPGGRYVLSAVIAPDRIVNVIRRQRAPGDWVIAVMDGDGRRVARSREHERYLAGMASPGLQRLMRSAREGTGDSRTIEDVPVRTAFTTSSRWGWTVVVSAPTASLRSPLLRGAMVYAAGLALTLAACIALASLLARRIVRRIDSLVQGAAALGAGKPVLVEPSRVREIGQMGQALAAAAAARDRHERERSDLLASLERAVASQEEALAEAREAGRAKDEFLAVLGHELRNPLSPIVASLDLMDLRGDAGAQRERAVLRRQVAHLKRLVDDLLDVSRIASGKLELELRPVDLADIVRQAVAAAATGLRVSLEAPDALWVAGDDSRLAQVLGNLLSNAGRFGGGAATVTLAEVPTRNGNMARLAVSDRGAGMAPDLLARVFDPFFQAPQQLARRTGGLGLGLAIVRKIVELHGGRVTAHSAGEGQGSTFEVLLPLAPRGLAPAGAPHVPVPQGLRVLLVDDNEDAAQASAQMLSHIGLDVRVAYTAHEALAAYGARPVDAALLDIGLPDMDGYALAAALREAAAGRALRLVALTGYGRKGDVERASAAGFDLHLTKPASLDDLRRSLGTGIGN
ncbi:hybrid sensor histidine kinase/response regulator [Pseudoduganella umbonata]|uniref:histidine kinase n=1 Tax=Pseudoduganella umbonata TaxID=864828 RepID=A0A4P8HPG2_9BURK|nr:ATP-binding protein [Pseudoduganella umbonata]MBB3220214.1 signal transduction histidine kinase/CheY-like chemotaxis protein [Pseudoduganella umbonata]QCP10195.1 response regulator [Pseudoduganella umbonata]